MEEPLALVRRFCEAFAGRDVEAVLAFFHEDAVYHNMPLEPVQGKAAIRSVLETFMRPAQEIEFRVLHAAAAGPVVFTERLDRFLMGERWVELPVAGVFEVREGKITAWRDYFDLSTWLKQTRGAGP